VFFKKTAKEPMREDGYSTTLKGIFTPADSPLAGMIKPEYKSGHLIPGNPLPD